MNSNRVYYGEYSVEHWINLLVTGNIELPEFQRSFVWSKEDVIKFIKSLKEGQFIPPVTIGKYEHDGQNSNIIIDGQQRLTSLLLAYLGKYPKKEAFGFVTDSFASGLEDDDDSDDQRKKWSIEKLKNSGSKVINIEEYKKDNEQYEVLSEKLKDEEIKKLYLGFSYLVPAKDVNRYYAKVFNSINTRGKSLSLLESRISLYFMEPTMKTFFDPECFEEYKIERTSSSSRLDFVRYLSTLVKLEENGRAYRLVASGYSKNMEGFYNQFIEEMVSQMQDSSSSEGSIYKRLFKDNFEERIGKVKTVLSSLDIPKTYDSIIDMDVYFFGLLFWILIKGKSFDIKKKEELKSKIMAKIASYKQDVKHKENPNSIGFLRVRMQDSIEIYDQYDE